MKIKFGIKPGYTHTPLTADILKSYGFKESGFMSLELELPKTYSCSIRILSFSGDYLYLAELEGEKRGRHDHLVCLWNKDLMREFYLDELQNLYYCLTGEELIIL